MLQQMIISSTAVSCIKIIIRSKYNKQYSPIDTPKETFTTVIISIIQQAGTVSLNKKSSGSYVIHSFPASVSKQLL
ncbi:hypothetical protein BH10BAC2_BH10BAC2_45570 [soil metagenome]